MPQTIEREDKREPVSYIGKTTCLIVFYQCYRFILSHSLILDSLFSGSFRCSFKSNWLKTHKKCFPCFLQLIINYLLITLCLMFYTSVSQPVGHGLLFRISDTNLIKIINSKPYQDIIDLFVFESTVVEIVITELL